MKKHVISNICKRCENKLGRLNFTSRKGSGLCKKCFMTPTDEERCVAITGAGKRCKVRIHSLSKKEYCGMHRKMFE